MSDLKLKAAAEELVKKAPDYAGRSAFPPSAWWIAGDQLFVIGADGRKFAGAAPAKSPEGAVSPKKALDDRSEPSPEKTSGKPAQSQATDPNAKKSEAGSESNPPAKHKAGK